MPFAAAERPSLGLTQLRAVLRKTLAARVRPRLVYPNLDFARRLGIRQYDRIAQGEYSSIGLGDWLFRQLAFPDSAENTEAYLSRFFPNSPAARHQLRALTEDVRSWLGRWLDELIADHRLDSALVVGFTSMFQQHVPSVALARRIKERNPAVTTVMGGANCEFPMTPAVVESFDVLDVVFSGPALHSFPAFIEQVLDPSLVPGDGIDGVFQRAPTAGEPARDRCGTGRRGVHGRERSINEPVELDYDDWLDEFDRQCARRELVPSLPFETARGCWWGERSHCTFCGLNPASMGYRAMQPDVALEQFRQLFRYADRCPMFEAVDDILAKHYFQEVLPQLDPPPGVTLFYEVKANLSDADVAALARASVRVVQPGIEALATSSLKLMGKGTSALHNLLLLKSCVRHGVHPTWNLLIGFPGEPESVYERYLRDFPLLYHVCPPSGVYPIRYDRFSPYFSGQDAFGLRLRPSDYYSYVYPFTEVHLAGLAYHFTDQQRSAEQATRLSWWAGRLNAAVRRWHERWYQDEEGGDSERRRSGDRLPDEGELVFRAPYRPVRPRLAGRLDENGDLVVHDSRCQDRQATTIRLRGLDARVTALLDQPADRRYLALVADAPAGEIAGAVARLHDHRLLFEEDGRLLSLVVMDAARRRPLSDGAGPPPHSARSPSTGSPDTDVSSPPT